MNVIDLHEHLAACWVAKGKQEFANKHVDRAARLRSGESMTIAERNMDDVRMMDETCSS